MYIVSQDKTLITTLDNIKLIESTLYDKSDPLSGCPYIIVKIGYGLIELGGFWSEERAKKVMEDIINTSSRVELDIHSGRTSKNDVVGVFYMPKE